MTTKGNTEPEARMTQPRKTPFDDLAYATGRWEIYRQDAGMGEYDYCVLRNGTFFCRTEVLELAKELCAAYDKTRPHPAPAFKRCCDSCINVPCKVLNRIPCLAQEKQENICEENGCTDIENCDEICQNSRIFSPLQMQEAKKDSWEQGYQDGASAVQHDINLIKDEAARQAREDVLKELQNWAPEYIEFKGEWVVPVAKLNAFIESLRSEQGDKNE